MKELKVLNLYAGIGGNRIDWDNVDVTAVEYDKGIAANYQWRFPNDKVVVGDAHTFLLEHYKEFDFIWASPPCPTHSKLRHLITETGGEMVYPDMTLYQEIIFLDTWFKGKYCVENVIPYYTPFIPAVQYDRHLYWANFPINPSSGKPTNHSITKNKKQRERGEKIIMRDVAKQKGVDFDALKGVNKKKVINNMVLPESGLYILNCARNIITKQNISQLDIFDNV